MSKKHILAKLAFLLLCSFPLLAQKHAPPTAIRFQGAPQYTQQELLAAAGLNANARVNLREMKSRSKQLSDTGMFEVVKFTANTKAVLFTLTPSTKLFPMHLDNLPLSPGPALDAKIHERFGLYRGQLPNGGSVVEGICRTLEEMLAAKNIKAVVKATLTSGVGPQKITAMVFSVSSPAVHIGRIQLSGISTAMEAKASLAASGQTGNDFDTENTALGLKHAFEGLYQDQGFLAVEVNVAHSEPLIAPDQSIEIPFAVTIKEGGIFKLGSIDYPASALVARAEVEKIRSKYPAGSGRPLDLFLLAVRDAYHAKGYLDCSVVPRPSFNDVTHVVNYGLEIVPGSQYRLASVKFDGAPDAMAAKLNLVWKMAPGDVFDETYISSFAALVQKKDKQLAKWMLTVITSYDVKADPATHEVSCTFRFAKPSQSPR